MSGKPMIAPALRSRGPLAAACALALLGHAALLLPRSTPVAQPGAAPAALIVARLLAAPAASRAPVAPPEAARHAAAPGRTVTSNVATLETPPSPSPSEPGFIAAAQLDAPLVPRSAPELTRLQGLAFSGLPMKLRLFIDAQGQVALVRVLSAYEEPSTLDAVLAMFSATAFVPGRRGGAPVASFTDIELQLGGEG